MAAVHGPLLILFASVGASGRANRARAFGHCFSQDGEGAFQPCLRFPISLSSGRNALAVNQNKPSEMTMKTLVSALVALSFLAGVVAPASAAEPFSIKQLDQDQRGGHAG